MILKEDGNDVFFSLLEVKLPAFVETETSTGASAEVLTSRSLFLNDTPRALSGTDGTCFFTGLTLECSPCLAFFAFAFGLEDMRKDPRLGLGARRSCWVDTTNAVSKLLEKPCDDVYNKEGRLAIVIISHLASLSLLRHGLHGVTLSNKRMLA